MYTPTIAGPALDLRYTYGPAFVATFLAAIFWGIGTLQTFVYFGSYKSDGRSLKLLVSVLSSFNTLHIVLCIKGLSDALVRKFGDIEEIEKKFQPASVWQIAVMGIVAAISQSFFTWRIWHFVKKKSLLIILTPLIIGQVVLSFVYVTNPDATSVLLASPKLLHRSSFVVMVLEVTLTITDVLIAVTMVISLKRRRTGFPSTDRMILRLINVSVGTGAATALFATVGFITALFMPFIGFVYLGQIPLSSLYCNAVLANLNSRKYLRGVDVLVEAPSDMISPGPSIRIRSLPTSSESRNPNTGSARDK